MVELGPESERQAVTNPDLVELARRVFQRTDPEPEGHDPIATEPSADLASEMIEPASQESSEADEQAALPRAPEDASLTKTGPTKEKKTAEELAAMILNDLSQIEGCPKPGVKVSVYGSNPWNAWLSFGVTAGPVRNKAER